MDRTLAFFVIALQEHAVIVELRTGVFVQGTVYIADVYMKCATSDLSTNHAASSLADDAVILDSEPLLVGVCCTIEFRMRRHALWECARWSVHLRQAQIAASVFSDVDALILLQTRAQQH